MLDLIKATTFDDAFPQGMFLLLGIIDVVAFKLRDTEFRHAPVGIKVSRLERISDYAGMQQFTKAHKTKVIRDQGLFHVSQWSI